MAASVTPAEAFSGIPESLRAALLAEYAKLSKNFRESRWEPSELNGGRLSEIVVAILNGYLTGNWPDALSQPGNMADACRSLERLSDGPRSLRVQVPRFVLALYEVRNNRNVGHVGGDVDPSQMDATVVLGMARWIMAELVRVFHDVTTEAATLVVEQLTERVIPVIWKVDGLQKVLVTSLSAFDKMMILLYGSNGPLPSRFMAASLEYQNLTQFRAKVVRLAHDKHFVHFNSRTDDVTLSLLGVDYVEKNLPLTVW